MPKVVRQTHHIMTEVLRVQSSTGQSWVGETSMPFTSYGTLGKLLKISHFFQSIKGEQEQYIRDKILEKTKGHNTLIS